MRRLLFSAMILTLAACTDVIGAPGSNQPPLIGVLAASPQTGLTPGQAIEVSVGATDPEGDFVQFAWTASAGTLSTPAGARVVWYPPTAPGQYILRVLASDGHGGTAGYLTLTNTTDAATLSTPQIVRPAQLPSPSPSPSPIPSSPPTATPSPSPTSS
jgi:hypothetical protein